MAIAAPTQLASVNSNTSGQTTWATGSITFPTTGTDVLGIMLLHVSGYTGALSMSVADSAGNTWTVVTGATASTTAGASPESTVIAFFKYPSAGGGTTVTVTATFGSCNERMGWCGYTTGHDTTAPQDASGAATTSTGVATVAPTTSGNLTANDQLLLVAWGDAYAAGGITPTWPTTSYTQTIAPMVDSVRHRSAAFEYQILTGGTGSGATQSTTVSYGTNSASTASIATFKPAAGGTNVTVTHVVGTTTLGGVAPTLTEALSPSVGLVTLSAGPAAPGDTLSHTVGTLTLGAAAASLTEAMVPSVGLVTLGAAGPAITGASAAADEFISGKLLTIHRAGR